MGCQMNEYDSDHLAQLLQSRDFLPIEDPSKADLILINTCTVRAKAEQKAYSLLGRMIGLKKRKPRLIVGLMGCIAQEKGFDVLARFPGLDFALGTKEIGNAAEIIDKIEREGGRAVATDLAHPSTFHPIKPGYFAANVKSFVTIMEGCDNFCSYCIVPHVRGRELSRPPEDIVKEIEALTAEGVREVTLLGQNVNSYRCDPREGSGFPSLLRKINRLDGILRIRFTTSHPKDLSDDLIQCFNDLDKLCPHIHLPFQAGSNKVLKAMRRGYTREHYIELTRKLRAVRSDIAITSDVMVGFPSETEQDFDQTLDLVANIGFDNLYSFRYSDRNGTLAAKMDPKISESEKAARLFTLQRFQKAITLQKHQNLVGSTTEVLVEGESKKGGRFTGRTGTNKVVNFSCDYRMIGYLIKLRIKDAFAHSLSGDIII